MTTIIESIERQADAYAEARSILSSLVAEMQIEIDAITANYLPAIRRKVKAAALEHDALVELVQDHPSLFESPRTLIFSGIKVGFRKGSGKLLIEDPERTIDLIIHHFTTDECQNLIIHKMVPDKKALEELDAATLKKLGCALESTGDQVVVKPVDSAVEKAVAALLKNAEEEEDAS